MKYICAILLFCQLLQGKASAQLNSGQGKLQGKVLDEHQHDFPYVSVSLLKAKDSVLVKGTLTDDKGNYSFNALPEGDYLITLNMVGYGQITTGPFKLSGQQTHHQLPQVRLTPAAKQLNGVNIVARKPLIERQVDKTVLNIENSVLAAGNTALEILQKAPGVSVDKDGNISLRGKKGVNVMMDGKPTYLSAEQLANLLRSTEGNAIQSIELITNPSAKYDASGNSGVINIKMKKNTNFGTNGSVKAGAGYGSHYKADAGLSLNHREKKFNVFGEYNYSRKKNFHDLDIMHTNNTATDPTFFDQTSHSVGTRKNSNYKAGLDYFLTDRHTVGMVVSGYQSQGSSVTDVLTKIGSRPQTTDSSVIAKNPNQFKYTGITYNLNYRGTLDTTGQEINADADYSRYNSAQFNTYNNQYRDASGQVYKDPYIFRNHTPSIVKIKAVKLDYTYPFSKKMKLETGLKASMVNTDNTSIFDNFNGQEWNPDLTRSNHFIYKEDISAAYVNLNRQFSATTIQLGLRAERTHSNGNSLTADQVADRSYFDLFPSLFVSRTLSKNHDLGFSYSRRIDRPDYESLNPFVYFVDLYTYSVGNPFLNPQYTHSFELNYSYKKTLNVALGYSHTSNAMTRVMLSDTLKKTVFISYRNLAVKNSYSLTMNTPLNLAKWWTTNNNMTVFYNEFKAPDLLGSPYKSGKLAVYLNTNQTFTLNSSTSLELSGYYQSALVEGTLKLKPQYGIDLGAGKTFLQKKLNLKLSANDIFYLQKWRINSALPSQIYNVQEREESRVFRLTCTYRFGSNDIKGARQRSKSAEAEQGRVRSGG